MTIIRGADIIRWETATFGDGEQFEDMRLHDRSLNVEITGSGEDERAIVTGKLANIIKASEGWFQDESGPEQVLAILEESILVRRV